MIDGPTRQIGSFMLESVRISFFLPALCFVVIAISDSSAAKLQRHRPA
jgi:hypothetical protein